MMSMVAQVPDVLLTSMIMLVFIGIAAVVLALVVGWALGKFD